MTEAGNTVESLTYCGQEFRFYLPLAGDLIQDQIRANATFYEVEMLECIQRIASPDGLAIDVGANIGNHTVYLAGVCGLEVIALEPEPQCFDILRRNVELNDLREVVSARALAAGAEPGQGVSLRVSEGNLGASRFQVQDEGSTEVVTIDSLEREAPVRLLKIDVEGMEAAVLEGAQRTLAEERPVVFVEAMKPQLLLQVRRILEAHDYRPVEQLNWTPTWLFMPARGDEEIAALHRATAACASSRLTFELRKMRLQTVKALEERSAADTRALQNKLDEISAEVAHLKKARREALDREAEEQRKEAAEQRKQLEQRIRRLQNSTEYALGSKLLTAARKPFATIWHLPGFIWRQLKKRRRVAASAQASEPTAPPSRPVRVDRPEIHFVPDPIEPIPAQDPQEVFDDAIGSRDWGEWTASGGAVLGEAGALGAGAQGGMSSAVRAEVAVEPGRHYRLTVEVEFADGAAEVFWIARDSRTDGSLNFYDGNQAPVIPLRSTDGKNVTRSLDFRTFDTIDKIDLHLAVRRTAGAQPPRIRRAAMHRIRAEEACPRPRLADGERVIASLASVPSRAKLLRNAVASLLPQVDEVRVFLNGYNEVPDFLSDQRITVERSQDWGDMGDVGKFFWVEDDTPGYRLTCDDDLVYPTDYTLRMVNALKRHRGDCIVGVHGVLIRQPLSDYYAPSSRFVRACRNNNPREHLCHVLGTGTVAYRAGALPLHLHDFPARNMADLWLAKRAIESGLPMLCVKRPDNWLVPREEADADSIFSHSSAGSKSGMNTRLIQNNVIRSLQPLSIRPSGLQAAARKLVLAIKTYNRVDYLKDCLESFLRTRSDEHEWVIIIADDGSTDGTRDYLASLVVPHELHVLENERRYAVGQTNTIFERARTIGFDFMFVVDDDLLFGRPGWDDLYTNAASASGYDHLCYFNHAHFEELQRRRDQGFRMPPATVDPSGSCEAHVEVQRCMGALFTVTPRVLESIGSADEANFPIRGQWHIDLSIRACRAGHNSAEHFFDARNSNDYLSLQNDEKGADYQCSIPFNADYKSTKDPVEMERRQAVMADPARVCIAPPTAINRPVSTSAATFFDKIYVLNLDRRTDRWERISRDAAQLGLPLHRFSAVDGRTEPHSEDYAQYGRQPHPVVAKHLQLKSSFDFYRSYRSDAARIQYFEQSKKRKTIGSPGAWGYLKTMIGILEDALENDYERILVLDDDVLFHRSFHELFARMVPQMPDDWLIMQLGALQYRWGDEWIRWRSDDLYMCQGSSLASHAVGMHRDAIPMALDLSYRMDMPYDEGPLQKLKRTHADRCLTCYPNLIIQDVSESDIALDETQSSQKQAATGRQNVYRWEMEDYIGASRQTGATQ